MLLLGIRFTLSADTQSLEKRLFFGNGGNIYTAELTANIGAEICRNFTAYVQVLTI